jgi:hypothetical protein
MQRPLICPSRQRSTPDTSVARGVVTALCCSLLASSSALSATRNTNGSRADVQAKIDAAVDGDIVVVPNGTFTWDTAVRISGKGIHLKGETKGSVAIRGAVSNGALIEMIEDATHSIELSNLWFSAVPGAPSNPLASTTFFVRLYGGGDVGKPVLMHDCKFTEGNNFCLYAGEWNSNRGVIWNCEFVSTNYHYNGLSFRPISDAASWTSASTMGADDTTGTKNVYVEDCHFQLGYGGVLNGDSNARVVVRRCTFYNALVATHGAEGPAGVRHMEIYDCAFTYNGADDFQNGSSVIAWFYLRGGTYVITDNTMPDVPWGKPEITLMVQYLRRNTGVYACWGRGIPGVQYPAPHQVGQSHNGTTTVTEPLYIWNNTGPQQISAYEYPEAGQDYCGGTGLDSVADYIRAGRDYKTEAKPGYRKYTYPHPLRTVQTTGISAPTNLRVTP